MTIFDLKNNKEISERTFNICKENKLMDVYLIFNYFKNNKSFKNLKRVGEKSSKELYFICEKYIDKNLFLELNLVEIIENPKLNSIKKLSKNKLELIDIFIEYKLAFLSARNYNALSSFLNNNFQILNISEKIFTNDEFKTKNIKNIGVSSIPEIEKFLFELESFVENLININDEIQINSLKNNFKIKKLLPNVNIPEVVYNEPLNLDRYDN
jgi:hypothetical protein